MITLKTLPAATSMEVFQQSSDHMLKQRARSEYVDSEGETHCMYRHGSMACPGGCFISDEEYDPDMETLSWATLAFRRGFAVPKDHYHLITAMQVIHDEAEVKDWPAVLAELKADLIQHPERFA
jgi:hypothetical protein